MWVTVIPIEVRSSENGPQWLWKKESRNWKSRKGSIDYLDNSTVKIGLYIQKSLEDCLSTPVKCHKEWNNINKQITLSRPDDQT